MKMAFLPALLCLSISAFPMFAVAEMTSSAQTQSTQADVQKNDGQIIELLNTVNSNEIKAASVALAKTSSPAVKDFAQNMNADHSANLADTKKLSTDLSITPEASAKSSALQQKGEKELNKLKALPSKEFDVAYIQAMVKGHEQALKLIDEDLLPKAANPKLKEFLITTRATVAGHLQMAKDLQKKL